MPAGSKWKVYIPQEMAYGEREAGAVIKPYSTLVFIIDLVSVGK
jgi:FKBP-type peptidyl-prolyl cis-trans isomerase FklB